MHGEDVSLHREADQLDPQKAKRMSECCESIPAWIYPEVN